MSTNALVPMSEMKELAHAVAASRMYGMQSPEQALVLMSLCRSKGLDPIEAVERYHIIEGRPSMRADAMQSEFMRQGGRIKWLRSDAEVCSAVFMHPEFCPDGFEVAVTFAELNASGVTAGKYGIKDNWKKFPRQMLRARVISEGVRAVMPSVVVGVYTPEEVQDFGDSKQVSVEPPPSNATAPTAPPQQTAPRSTRYRQAPPAAPTAETAPTPKAEPANVAEAEYAPVTEPTAQAPAATEAPAVPEPTKAPEPQPELPLATAPTAEPPTKTVEAPDVAALIASLPETAPTVFLEQRKLATVLYAILDQTDPEAKAAYQCDLRAATNDSKRVTILNKMLKEVKA